MVPVHLLLFTFTERLITSEVPPVPIGASDRVRVARVPGSVEYPILKISLNSSDMD